MPAQRTEQGQSHIDVSIATEPNDIEAIPTLLREITQAFDAFTTSNAGREDLLAKCRTLVQALETPRETMIYHCWAHASTPPLMPCKPNEINWQIDRCNCWPELWCGLGFVGTHGAKRRQATKSGRVGNEAWDRSCTSEYVPR